MRIAQSVAELGLAVVEEALSSAEVDRLLADLASYPFTRSRAGIRNAMSHPSVAAIANDPRLLTLASEVLGWLVFPYRATLFDKSPGANWLVVRQQHTALPLKEPKTVHGWGRWSVKEEVNYAHAPAAALNKVLALRQCQRATLAIPNSVMRLPPADSVGSTAPAHVPPWDPHSPTLLRRESRPWPAP